MASDLRQHYFEAATDGENADTNPDLLGKREATYLSNLLTYKKGSLVLRGPIKTRQVISSNATETANAYPCGIWAYNDKLIIGVKEFSSTRTREPWVATYRKATATTQLARPRLDSDPSKSYAWYVDMTAGTSSLIGPFTRAVIPGPRYTRVGGRVYGITYDSGDDSTTIDAQGSGATVEVHRLTFIAHWSGTAVEPTAYINAPRGGQDIIHHHNRLWVLCGRDPNYAGTTPAGTAISDNIQFNALYYSDPLDPDDTPTLPDTIAAWQDSNGATQKILVDSNNVNDVGVALARVGQNLVIFKRNSIHILYGYSPDTFNLKPLRQDIGCIDPRSVVEVDGGVYFMSEGGFMFFDGQRFTNVSENLHSTLTSSALTEVGEVGRDGGAVVATAMPNNYIFITTGRQPFSSGGSFDQAGGYAYLFHYPTRSWTRFSSTAFTALSAPSLELMPLYHAKSGILNKPFAFNLNPGTRFNIYTMEYVTIPAASAALTIRQRDINEAGSPADISPAWYTRLLSPGGMGYRAHLKRMFLDYRYQIETDSADDTVSSTWQVQLRSRTNVALGSLLSSTPSTGHDSGGVPLAFFRNRRRAAAEVRAETDLIVGEITAATASATESVEPGGAELFGVGVEYQIAHEKRSGA